MTKKVKKMENGTDVTKLYAGDESFPVEIEYQDQIWKFEFKEITWAQKKRVQSESMKRTVTRDGKAEMKVDMEKMYIRMFQLTNTKAPVGFDITKISDEFGEILVKHIPGMDEVEVIDEDDTKN
jgi:hypothetical protein